jgi:hypothetical protein
VCFTLLCGLARSYSFTTFLKPPRDLSATAPLLNEDILLRFESFRSLVLDVCCRLLACRLRSLEPEVLLDHKVLCGLPMNGARCGGLRPAMRFRFWLAVVLGPCVHVQGAS